MNNDVITQSNLINTLPANMSKARQVYQLNFQLIRLYCPESMSMGRLNFYQGFHFTMTSAVIYIKIIYRINYCDLLIFEVIFFSDRCRFLFDFRMVILNHIQFSSNASYCLAFDLLHTWFMDNKTNEKLNRTWPRTHFNDLILQFRLI